MPSQSDTPHPDQLLQIEQLLDHFAQLEAQFQQVRDGLTHSHRLATLGTIASIIAHEYNNILTPVVSYSQMALANPEDHEMMRTAVEKALAGAERAANITSSLLGFAREADQEHVAELKATIRDTIACLARDPKKDGIQLTVDVPDVHVAMSPLNLQQVLLNLVLNAIQAMRGKGGNLRITGHIDGNLVHLEVADTGPGIPPEIMDRLFEPFVTHRQHTSFEPGERKGTGLGLCICKDLVGSVGGSISVESVPGQGATFHMTIPKAEDILETT